MSTQALVSYILYLPFGSRKGLINNNNNNLIWLHCHRVVLYKMQYKLKSASRDKPATPFLAMGIPPGSLIHTLQSANSRSWTSWTTMDEFNAFPRTHTTATERILTHSLCCIFTIKNGCNPENLQCLYIYSQTWTVLCTQVYQFVAKNGRSQMFDPLNSSEGLGMHLVFAHVLLSSQWLGHSTPYYNILSILLK